MATARIFDERLRGPYRYFRYGYRTCTNRPVHPYCMATVHSPSWTGTGTATDRTTGCRCCSCQCLTGLDLYYQLQFFTIFWQLSDEQSPLVVTGVLEYSLTL